MIVNANALRLPFAPQSAQMCVTSPPYWGLRDYGVDGQLGTEDTPAEYVDHIVSAFREVRRVLKDDGALWLNLGDSYVNNPGNGRGGEQNLDGCPPHRSGRAKDGPGLKPKDLVGIPWMVAFALQADGWWLRQDIIWAKPNPMPESVTDRCTKSHEYVFLLTKSAKYYYNAEAIAEPVADSTIERCSQDVENQNGSDRIPGKTNGNMKAVLPRYGGKKYTENPEEFYRSKSGHAYDYRPMRNKRSVWTIPTQPTKFAHFATMPEKLVETCILAGSRPGDIVLDPFMGSGTVERVAIRLRRIAIGTELNMNYMSIIEKRTSEIQPYLLVR
jgi:DNA modification methylase